MTDIYPVQCFVSELLVYIFYCFEVTRSTHSDMVVVLLWQKQRTDHQLCPGWEWAGYYWVEWEWTELGSQAIELSC